MKKRKIVLPKEGEARPKKRNVPKNIDLSKEEIVSIIRSCGGYIKDISEALQVSPDRTRNLIKRTKEYREALFDAREESVDIAEAQLMHKVKEGNLLAIMFKLKCHGQERGYIDSPQKKPGSSIDKPLYIKLMPVGISEEKKVGRPKKEFGEIKILPEKNNKNEVNIRTKEEDIIEGEILN
jgi:hypothetical protein